MLSFILGFVLNPMFLLGYAICVLFPIPFLNSFVLNLWSKFGSQIVALFKKLTGQAVTAAEGVVTTVVATAVTTNTVVVTSNTVTSNTVV